MAERQSAIAFRSVVSNPELLDKIDKAKSGAAKRRLLHEAGLGPDTNPTELRAEVERMLRLHSKGTGNRGSASTVGHQAPTEQDLASVGLERPVEWVAALATLAVAAL